MSLIVGHSLYLWTMVLGRTFPSHPYFTSQLGSGQLALYNLLKAFSLLDKEVGYCQGLSFVAGVLLMHVSMMRRFKRNSSVFK